MVYQEILKYNLSITSTQLSALFLKRYLTQFKFHVTNFMSLSIVNNTTFSLRKLLMSFTV